MVPTSHSEKGRLPGDFVGDHGYGYGYGYGNDLGYGHDICDYNYDIIGYDVHGRGDYYGIQGYGSGASSAMEWGAAPHPHQMYSAQQRWDVRPLHRYGVRGGPTAAETVRLYGELDDIEERIRTLRRHGAYGSYGVIASGGVASPVGTASGMRPTGVEKKRVEEEIDILEGTRQRIMRELNRRENIVANAKRGGPTRVDDLSALRMGGPLPNADPSLRPMSSLHVRPVPEIADGSIEAMARALEAKAAAMSSRLSWSKRAEIRGSGEVGGMK